MYICAYRYTCMCIYIHHTYIYMYPARFPNARCAKCTSGGGNSQDIVTNSQRPLRVRNNEFFQLNFSTDMLTFYGLHWEVSWLSRISIWESSHPREHQKRGVIYLYIHIYICAYLFSRIYVYISYVYTYIYLKFSTPKQSTSNMMSNICTHTHIYMCIFMNTHVYILVYTHICTYI